MEEDARAAALAPPTGPFAGVPFLAKDLLSQYAGHPTTAASRLLAGLKADHDTELVRRVKAAGLVVFGKTNLPEWGLVPTTESELYGPCRNPWDTGRTPGGSSGGSAAAVAARIVPMAGGGDGGGSIRIPASCCGLFGLKPTRGRTPTGPDYGLLWRGAVVEHVLTRSVRDSAAMLDATHGPDAGAPFEIPPPARPYLTEVEQPPGRLRIAWTAHPLLPAEVHPDCVAAVQDAAQLLAGLGHDVEEATPELDGEAFARAFLTMVAAELGADLDEYERTTGRKARRGSVRRPPGRSDSSRRRSAHASTPWRYGSWIARVGSSVPSSSATTSSSPPPSPHHLRRSERSGRPPRSGGSSRCSGSSARGSW